MNDENFDDIHDDFGIDDEDSIDDISLEDSEEDGVNWDVDWNDGTDMEISDYAPDELYDYDDIEE